jgi:copper resistance protein C
MMRRTRCAAIVTVFMLAMPIAWLIPSAHAETPLLRSVPAPGSIVRAPEALSLKFSDAVDPMKTGVEVSGPGRLPVATRAATPTKTDPTSVTVPLTSTLKAGLYIIEWHALTRDGLPIKGCYSFEIRS